MSELKTYLYMNDKDKVICGYYKATEADALIAKLREENEAKIAELNARIEELEAQIFEDLWGM